ncbi:MAG: cupredoxin domain-containing protein, partial [Nitrosopumilaceae archaeon]
ANPSPGGQTNLQVNFINKGSNDLGLQPHIDYKISIMQGGNQVFGIPVTHTAQGSVSTPFQFQQSGTYQVVVYVEGILFQPIPEESTSFGLTVGGTQNTPSTLTPQNIVTPIEIDIHTGSSNPSSHLTFYPPSISAAVGQTLEFANGDTVTHEIVSGTPSTGPDGKFDSGTINPGQYYTYTVTGNDVGLTHFYDKSYSWMTGVVIVGSGTTQQQTQTQSVPQTTQPTPQSTTPQSTTPQSPPQSPPEAIVSATQQDIASIAQAKYNQTIAAEVNVVNQTVQTTSIDNNVSVQANSQSSNSLSVTVTASSQTNPKVILINLGATTINVGNLKYLGIMYDGQPINPASDVDSLLHAKSTDSPKYAIIITQSGA